MGAFINTMFMAEKYFGKLVRDGIPGVIQGKGERPVWRALTVAEFSDALRAKLREEIDELLAAGSSEEITGEVADVLEVLMAIAKAQGLSWDAIEVARQKKLAERGGFEQMVFLEKVETD